MGKPYPAVLGWELFKMRQADQSVVGRELGIDQPAFSQWENGTLVPTLPSLVRLVHCGYGRSVEDLLIKVASEAVWDKRVPLLKFPRGHEFLATIPKDLPLISALVAHDLGSLIPRSR